MENKVFSQNNPFTITELTETVSKVISENLHSLLFCVTGEIESFNVAKTSSGNNYAYLTLKDEKSQIQCMIWSYALDNIVDKFSLKEDFVRGKKIVVTGKISPYAQRGTYNLQITNVLSVEGITGDSLKKQRLIKALKQEGIIDRPRKSIPKFPRSVAILAADKKAAIADVLSGIKERYPLVKIHFYPTAVQGQQAVASVCDNIEKANKKCEDDFIIICRGGGSSDDLKAFDEEQIVRTVVASKLPIAVAIGHEIDTSVTDMVSDLSFKTPTKAAEECFPKLVDVLEIIKTHFQRIKSFFLYVIQEKNNKRLDTYNRLLASQPVVKYKEKISKLENKKDSLLLRLKHVMSNYLFLLEKKIIKHDVLKNNLSLVLERKENKLYSLKKELEIKNPKKILEMGYAKLSSKLKEVTSIKEVSVNEDLKVILKDGFLKTKIIEKKEQ